MFSIIYIIYIKIIYICLQQAAGQYAINENITDAFSSRLTGAYRPAEMEVYEKMSIKSRYCLGSLAKYIVSIRHFEREENFGHKHICGGIIVRTNLILTAAHCFRRNKQNLRASSLRVVASSPWRLRKTPETQIIQVKKIIIHELFSSSFNIDIALVKLQKHIKIDSNCAAVVNMPEQSINASISCIVLGWGRLYANGPLANEILQLNVTLHAKNYCEPFFFNASKGKLCASDGMHKRRSPCSGDSGGPLFCEGILTGIVSYGFQCNSHFPTVYTDIFAHRNWIIENKGHKLIFLGTRFLSSHILLIIWKIWW